MKRLFSSLGHCLSSLAIQLLCLIIMPAKYTIIAPIFFYYGREKVQHEYRLKGDESTSTVWQYGWIPFEWPFSSQLDLYLPAITAVCVSQLLIYMGY